MVFERIFHSFTTQYAPNVWMIYLHERWIARFQGFQGEIALCKNSEPPWSIWAIEVFSSTSPEAFWHLGADNKSGRCIPLQVKLAMKNDSVATFGMSEIPTFKEIIVGENLCVLMVFGLAGCI